MQSNSKRTKEKEYGLLRGSRDLQDTKKVLGLIIIQNDLYSLGLYLNRRWLGHKT
jgi:hypothetical protein